MCECGTCRCCLRRMLMRRIRAAKRAALGQSLAPMPADEHSPTGSSWQGVEEALRLLLGPPTRTYLQHEHSVALGRVNGGKYHQRATRAAVRQQREAVAAGLPSWRSWQGQSIRGM